MDTLDRVDPNVRVMLSDLIEADCMSQAEIARAIGVSRGRINQVVNKTNPSDLKSGSKEKLKALYDSVFKYESA